MCKKTSVQLLANFEQDIKLIKCQTKCLAKPYTFLTHDLIGT